MSVRPTASQTRTPLGTGIIAAPERRAPVPMPRHRHHGRREPVVRPASSISISPAFLRRRRRGASLISAGLSAATGTGNAETSLVISMATKDGSSEAPGTPITRARPVGAICTTAPATARAEVRITDRFAPGAVASASTANFCSTLNRRRRSMRPRTSAPRYDIDLALLLAPVPSQHPASSSGRWQGGRHRRETIVTGFAPFAAVSMAIE